ncbi:WD40 domain-containing protein [Dyadobacter aurulentus]|uniref:WD40 domain-containing protein n=1 Tax=Dyadobacter sp. UC 10 TaxID=2605428 RepID=UPI0011F1F643|nr:hypothetical protein [Dyadobacter sp. UC 10]KAA0992084.1 hypothetical protein FXO21_18835 [Dyadobacter sp. UC 10]
MPLLPISLITSLGLSILSGLIKYYKRDITAHSSEIALESLDGIFSGVLGSICHEGYSHVRDKIANAHNIDRNSDIERCSRLALLNALIAFSEACLPNIETLNIGAEDKKACLAYLLASQKRMRSKIEQIPLLDHNALVASNNLSQDNQYLDQILSKSLSTEQLKEITSNTTHLVLSEYVLPKEHALFDHLKQWIENGTPNGAGWFPFYVLEMHSNLKKDNPAYCKNARRILQQKQLAEIKILSYTNLKKLDELHFLSSKLKTILLEVRRSLSAQILEVSLDVKLLNSKIDRLLIAHKKSDNWNKKLNLHLLKGSLNYFTELKGPNGPFRNLAIEGQILADIVQVEKSQTQALPISVKDSLGRTTSLLDGLENAWKARNKETLIIGDGGMGKTISLLHLWESYLSSATEKKTKYLGPVPIFIRLDEYNIVTESEREGFIVNRICWHYLGVKTKNNATIDALWAALTVKSSTEYPAFILLIDGYNEVTVAREHKRHLLLELQALSQKTHSCQFVLSSRYHLDFTWTNDIQTLVLQSLTDQNVRSYLKKQGIHFDSNAQIDSFIQIPMMLTIFANTCEIVEEYKSDVRFNLKKSVTTSGELLWNFIESQIIKLAKTYEVFPYKYSFSDFLIRHFIPYLAYRMEYQGHYILSESAMRKIVDETCQYFYNERFLEVNPKYNSHFLDFDLGKSGFAEQASRFARIIDAICLEIGFIKKDLSGYQFLHQNFRDFFSVIHIFNELTSDRQLGIQTTILRDRVLPYEIRQFLGQVLGEHYHEEPAFSHSTLLLSALNSNRGIFEEDSVGFTIANIVNVLRDCRQHLGGIDFSNLNLSRANFQKVSCSTKVVDGYQTANFQNSLINENCFIRSEHQGQITDIAFHPKGRFFASGSLDRTIKVWDIFTGQCLYTLGNSGQEGSHPYGIYNISFHPTEDTLFSTYLDGSFKIWNLTSRSCRYTYLNPEVVEILKKASRLVLSPEGSHFIFSGKVWQLGDGAPTVVKEGFPSAEIFHPGGSSFLSFSERQIYLWDIETGINIHTFKGVDLSRSNPDVEAVQKKTSSARLQPKKGHLKEVLCASFQPGGDKIITGGVDNAVCVWNTSSTDALYILKEHTGNVNCVDFGPDGSTFLSASSDKTIKMWDLNSRQCLQTFKAHQSSVTKVKFTPDGKFFVSASNDRTIRIWETRSGQCVFVIERTESPINRCVFDRTGERFLVSTYDNSIRLWDSNSGICLNTFTGHAENVTSLAFNPNGDRFISGSSDSTINLWDVHSGKSIATFVGHTKEVTCLAFHPNGQSFISGSKDRSIKVWDISHELALKSLNEHQMAISCLQFDASGKYFFSGSWDCSVKVWDFGKLNVIKNLLGHSNTILSIGFNTDSGTLTTGSEDRTIRIWNISEGIEEKIIHAFPDVITDISFSANSRHLFYASRDGKICTWTETENSWRHRADKFTKNNPIIRLAFSDAGEQLLSVSNQGHIKIRPIRPESEGKDIEIKAGLYVSGCIFFDFHPNSSVSGTFIKTMRDHGAAFDTNDLLNFKLASGTSD